MDKAIFGLFSDVENNPITTSLGYEAVFFSLMYSGECIKEQALLYKAQAVPHN